ncbi:sigma-54 interaction domain-containing protein [Billgrantia ethanolica]|uniref:Sigma-54-dependent Fis family transcriptional regulator n=1 Tax=Billgrantia ethanolica TaxID=2733486 RepID=A0ABS9A9S5_9GAMM|nr:sigma-54 dependent transcriptional regulator [Halomonas ethanolica]MCE8004800.1 sigma-54-dependent Fis family transcriptional regulator [Halomonas ethanolica]
METHPHVILVDRKPARSRDMLDALSAHGYRVTQCEDPETASQLSPTRLLRAGLLYLENDDLDALPAVEKLIAASDFEWVALIDPQRSTHPKVRYALGQLFHSVHPPNDIPGLHCLLLHVVRRHAIAASARERPPLLVSGKRMVSRAPCMRRVIEQIQVVAGVDAPVFITGESGTGKELAARAIHELSARAKAPFIAVNCGAIPPNLIQSELFGYEKGAFTDAHDRRMGKIEAASGGTLFLDEISELPYDLQANFLRFIESGSISRLGSHRETQTDVRIIAATNRDVTLLAEEGHFRQDLFYRLNVLEIEMPPLRERKQDIEPLVELFFERFKQYRPPGLKGVSTQAMRLLREHDWPGNIRELMNTVCRAMLMSDKPYIEATDLPIGNPDRPQRPLSLEEIRQQVERTTIVNALKRSRYNIARASRELGVSRVTLYRLMDKHDIQRLDDRS